MKNTFLIIFSLLMLFATNAEAQRGKKSLNVWYNYALPLGDFKDNIAPDNSPRAATVELLWTLNPQLSVGLSGGFANFYNKRDRATYKMEDGSDISAVMVNNVQTMPVLVTAVYSPLAQSFESAAAMQPFVQIGAGAAMLEYERYLGQFSNASANKVQFAAKAGAGVKIPFGSFKQNGVQAGVHYHYNGFNVMDVKSMSYITGGIGVSIGLFE